MFRYVLPGQIKRARTYSIDANGHPEIPKVEPIKTIRTRTVTDDDDIERIQRPPSENGAQSVLWSSSSVTFELGEHDDHDQGLSTIESVDVPSPSPPDPIYSEDRTASWARNLPAYIHKTDLLGLTEVTQYASNILHKRVYGLNKSPKDCLISLFPQFFRLKNYQAQWMLRDFFAGFIVSLIHFTQVFASAMTASLNPYRGLPLLIFPGFVYAFMTTSPHNSLGGMPITAAAQSISNINIEKETYPDAKYNATYALTNDDTYLIHTRISTGIAFVAGCTMICLGLLKLGFLSAIVSPTVTDPFSIACCLQSVCSQLPSMFGIITPLRFGYGKPIQDTIYFLSNLARISGWETLLSISYAVCLLGFREYLQPLIFRRLRTVVPLEFMLYLVAVGLSYAFDFSGRGFRVVGKYEYGLPAPSVPGIGFGTSLIFGGFVNAIVAYSVTLRSAQTLARKSKDLISPNQELLALGVAHVFGSFFNCGSVAAPMGRGNVNQSMGSRSQLSTIAACLIMGLVVGYAGPVISHIPVCIISANIVLSISITVKGFAELPKIWRTKKFDACVWVLTFVTSIGLNVQIGLIIGIAVTILDMIMRSQKPKVRVLGRLKNSVGFVPLKYYEKAAELAGLRIIQIQSPLHYANASYLVQHITTVALEPYVGSPSQVGGEESTSALDNYVSRSFLGLPSKKAPVMRTLGLRGANSAVFRKSERYLQQQSDRSQYDPRAVSPSTISQEFILMADGGRSTASRIILDLGTVGYIDAIGIRALEQLASDLKLKAVEIMLAQCKGSLLKQLKELEIHKIIPERNIFPSVVDAVDEALRRIQINTQPAEGLIDEYEDERFWDVPVIPVNGYPVINYDLD